MPLNARNTKTFHNCLYAGQLETVRLLAREPNFSASVEREVVMFRCRWRQITKQGQILDDEQSSDMRRELMIPRTELDRVGVAYINACYRFIDKENRYWQAESDTPIVNRLWENYVSVSCKRIDPTNNPAVRK